MERDIGQRERAILEELGGAGRGRLVKAAHRILDDSTEAEDVVQETLTEVWKRLAETPPRRLKAYVFRAVQFNALKRRARRKRHASLDTLPEVAVRADDEEEDPDRIRPFELERALGGLPKTQQTVLRMKYYLGMSFREIAQTLGVSANTVSSRCRYALAALRKNFTRRDTGTRRR